MALNVKRYRVKPDNQSAVEVTNDNMQQIAQWCGGSLMEGMGIEEGKKGDYLYIPTLQGPITAQVGEIVAKGSDGKFNVFDKDRFLTRYEEVGLRMSGDDLNFTSPRIGGRR